MISFPPCKINLGLNIVAKRADGFHDLETIFYPVPFKDALEILPWEKEGVRYSSSGLTIEGSEENNLCVKAYHLIKKDYPEIPGVRIHLHKVIPMGAGLGGGSSDAVQALLSLKQLFHLDISTDKMAEYALTLGSDCPFFLSGKPCLATGRGEKLQTLDIDLSHYQIIIVNPGIHVSTREAFSMITPAAPVNSLSEIIQSPINNWKDKMVNDFEIPVFTHHPAIREIKKAMYSAGAVYASMSGSGSSVFGLFEKEQLVDMPYTPVFCGKLP